jgi:hypothetical protein
MFRHFVQVKPDRAPDLDERQKAALHVVVYSSRRAPKKGRYLFFIR